MIKIIEHELDERGQNKDIKFKCLPDEEMISLGFRRCDNFDSNRFYMCKSIGEGITFDITVFRNDKGEIDMLDNSFCQPFDWQHMIHTGRNDNFICNIQKNAYSIMTDLKNAGVVSNWEIGDYI